MGRDLVNDEGFQRRCWIFSGVIVFLICLAPGIWLVLDHYKYGDLKIHLVHDAYTEYKGIRYTKIYAVRHTYWGLGANQYYEIIAIKGEWHIKERDNPKDRWRPMWYFNGKEMDVYALEHHY